MPHIVGKQSEAPMVGTKVGGTRFRFIIGMQNTGSTAKASRMKYKYTQLRTVHIILTNVCCAPLLFQQPEG